LEQLQSRTKKGNKRQQFKPGWVKFPVQWIEALRHCKSASAYRLALIIHLEAFKRSQTGGEIVLSMQTTGIPRSTRARAVSELVKLGLIKVKQEGKQAVRVTKLRTR
jgi:hypothetical protein